MSREVMRSGCWQLVSVLVWRCFPCSQQDNKRGAETLPWDNFCAQRMRLFSGKLRGKYERQKCTADLEPRGCNCAVGWMWRVLRTAAVALRLVAGNLSFPTSRLVPKPRSAVCGLA